METTITTPKKRRRVFVWFFLAIQIIFIIWLIVGISSAKVTPDHADVVKACYNGAWQGVFNSQSDCMVHYANGLKQAGEAGTAIGAGLIVLLWFVTDVIVSICYGIYRLAFRRH